MATPPAAIPATRRAGRWAVAARRMGVAALAGVLVSLGWRPYDLAPLAVLGLVLLLIVVRDRPRGRRFLLGWLGGAVSFGLSFYWVYGTVQEMSGLPSSVAGLAVVLFALWHGLQWGLFALFAEPVRRWSGHAALLAVPALWALLERFFPMVFPIFVGYGQRSLLPLVQIVDIVGPFGLSLLVLLVAASLAEAALRVRAARSALVPLLVAFATLLVMATYGFVRIAQVERSEDDAAREGRRLRVALVQPNFTIDEKTTRVARERHRVLQRSLDLSAPLVGRRDLDAVIWPEGANPFYLLDLDIAHPKRGNYRQLATEEIREMAARLGVDFVLGSLRRPGERTRNTAEMIPGDGGHSVLYDKMVLVPFGETMPLSDSFPSLRGSVSGVSDIRAGDRHVQFHLGDAVALVTICYEAILPNFVRSGLLANGDQANLILNLTNDVWFEDSRALDLHLMAQSFRTIEDRVPLVRATTTGVTAVIRPDGSIQAQSLKLRPWVTVETVSLPRMMSLYRSVGDLFLWIVVAMAALACAWGWWRRRAEPSALAAVPIDASSEGLSHPAVPSTKARATDG